MQTFYKMSGSGNDFIFVDARQTGVPELTAPDRIRALCARGTGIGADGMVFLESDQDADVRIRYFNSDGSVAALCGNATLCTVRLASELALGTSTDLDIATDAGIVHARMQRGVPEFDIAEIARVTLDVPIPGAAGERRLGYAVVGIPHLVVEVDDTDAIDVVARGRVLRTHPWTAAPGANVNFVSADPGMPGAWRMRTYERGVEGETLACGTGAVATATLLVAWGSTCEDPVRLRTRCGQTRGEGRLVFRGELADV
jgi:diaminopimelate epimerase